MSGLERASDFVMISLKARGWTLAVAESLTGGLLANSAARLPDAATWFAGGLVAYSPSVKRSLLGIGDAPVVSQASATAMATNVARLFDADTAIAVTGVGGPEPEDGIAPGTVWIASYLDGAAEATLLDLHGVPREVIDATCSLAFEQLASVLSRHTQRQADHV